MAIKQQPVLTKDDFEAALVTLRLSVSEVSRETSIPRHIVSHFRNYGDGLKPEQAAKLRDWLEDKGVEFTAEEETTDPSHPTVEQPSSQQSLKMPLILSDDGLTQRTALVCRHFFVDERLTDEQIKDAGKRFEEGFSQAKELLGIELVRKWPSDNYDETTETKLRELWGHLARIGLLSLHLQGRVLINQERILANSFAEDDKPKPITFGDLLSDTYSETVAGLNASEGIVQAGAEEEGVTS
ncbi:MAG: hypothetical protein Q7T29_07135 [Gallionella sp.]|nr:hypothetical protein [Gallionella sp.]